jgi:restriction endonuclease S subunit
MNNIFSRHTDPNKVFIINRSEIDGRIDPEYYNPEYKIPDSKIFTKIRKITTQIIHPPEYPREFSGDGFQLIRSQNVRPLGLTLHENPVFFSAEFLEKKKYSLAKKGDVLVVRSGVNAGDVAVVENNYANVIIGADTLLCRCSEDVIPKFLQVYFFTDFGKRQITKNTTGATNKHLNSENLGKVFIPILDIKIQNRCVDIFEEALDISKQKEIQAQELLASIDDYLLAELGITLPEKDNSLQNRIFTTQFSEVSGDRFDPNYRTKFSYLTKQKGNYELVPFGSLLMTSPQYGANEEAKDGNPKTDVRYIRITDIDELGNLKTEGWKTAENIEERYMLNKNDLLFARSGSVGRCYIHKDINSQAIFAGYLIRFIVDTNLVNPDYIFYYCNSAIYKFWVDAIQRPAVQSNINSEEYKSLPIPRPSLEKQTEIANHIANIRSQAKQLQQEAQDILEQAKKEVEKIILG